jgi:beta-glucosidase
MATLEFPKSFFWGAGTSAYQVEGDNINSDWWEWEKRAGLKDRSGKACRQYELYEQDFGLARELGHNCHRLSVEWSRIEPEDGKFCAQEISHYLDVISALRQRNLEPIVTLHHFTNPLWFAGLGGWTNNRAPEYFARYVTKAVEAIGHKVKYWVTINEPMVYLYQSYVLGVWPPQENSLARARIVMDNLLDAHTAAYGAIQSFYRQKGLLAPYVSIAKNLQAFVACIPSLKNKFAVYLREKYFNFKFIHILVRRRALDYIGINYYTRSLAEARGWGLKSLLLDICDKRHSQLPKNSLGWDIYPEGLYDLLLKLERFNLPVFILENGICTDDDNARWDFIREHLMSTHRAMSEGVKVLGYLYWSLIDNFEWDKGFSPRFGLIEVDYNTYARKARESARKLSLVCRTGRLT